MLQQREAITIVFGSELPEGRVAREKRLAAAPKELRQILIKQEAKQEDGRSCAAIEIQRVWRGYCTRCKVFNAVQPKASGTAIYSGSKHIITRMEEFREDAGEDEGAKTAARLRLERQYDEYISKMLAIDQASELKVTFQDFCAIIVKNWWFKKRKIERTSEETVEHVYQTSKPVMIKVQQQKISPKVAPKKKFEMPLSQRKAAIIIQRAWRRHIDIQVYNYYRDLINFKTRGEPRLMLRCINPNESKLLDAAAGVHVRFRLAGVRWTPVQERFPPNIYYKIFTHRPIVDMCACSPKDYTSASSKDKMARNENNKASGSIKNDRIGWYQRMENNGWRLVSDRLIHHMMNDPVTWETSRKKINFHHERLQRRQDVEKKKKAKKMDWMKKMYQEGMLKARAEDQETITLIDEAAMGMMSMLEKVGPAAVEDWEVDELLDWTTGLNFEDYINGWKEMATSAASEKLVDDQFNIIANGQADPYELSLPSGMSRYRSEHQSHNTPATSPLKIETFS